jgi:hypothetical protein
VKVEFAVMKPLLVGPACSNSARMNSTWCSTGALDKAVIIFVRLIASAVGTNAEVRLRKP